MTQDRPNIPGLGPIVLQSLQNIRDLAQQAEKAIQEYSNRRSLGCQNLVVIDSIPNLENPKYSVTLDQDWQEDEKGNVLLVCSYDDSWNAWLRIGGLDSEVRLEISWRPENYPSLNLCLVQCSDENLYQHLVSKFSGDWIVRKLNLSEHSVFELQQAWAHKEE